MFKLLLRNKKCSHEKITPMNPAVYCPDCGEEIKISWQFLRCECCSAKRKFAIYRDKTVPEDKFCKNCGCPEFYLEIKERPEFFDYEYAYIIKEVAPKSLLKETVQIWVEKENNMCLVNLF